MTTSHEHQNWEPVVFGSKKSDNTRKVHPKSHSISKEQKLDSATEPPGSHKKPVEKFGLRIQQIRTAKGFTQKTFANFLNLSESTIKDYESNKLQPDGHIRTRIMRKTGCKL